MSKAIIFLPIGFEETEAVTTIDILRRGGVTVSTASLDDERMVTGAHGVPVLADITFSQAASIADADMLILPGGPGHTRYKEHKPLLDMLQRHYEQNRQLAAICAAPVVFGMLGLLDGKEAVCYPGCENQLKGARLAAGHVAVSGAITTAKGPGSATAFAISLLRTLEGDDAAEAVAEKFVYTP